MVYKNRNRGIDYMPLKVVFYGFYARNDYNNESDIDVVGIVKGDRLEIQEQQDIVTEFSSDIDLKYDVLTFMRVISYREFIK